MSSTPELRSDVLKLKSTKMSMKGLIQSVIKRNDTGNVMKSSRLMCLKLIKY